MLVRIDQIQNREIKSTVLESRISPIVDIDYDSLDSGSQEVAQIRVLKDGKYVNYWVRIQLNNQNRVQCEVSTNVAETTRRKVVTAGAWRDQ